MSIATTVKLPHRLKKRIAPLAKAAGKSAHAWMVDTIASQVEREELRQSFVAEARESLAAVAKGAPVYDGDEVFSYVRARIAGRKATRPAPIKRSR